MFADHIGNLTVELVLASAEVKEIHFSQDFVLTFVLSTRWQPWWEEGIPLSTLSISC